MIDNEIRYLRSVSYWRRVQIGVVPFSANDRKVELSVVEKDIGYQMGSVYLEDLKDSSWKDIFEERDEAGVFAGELTQKFIGLVEKLELKEAELNRLKAACWSLVKANDSESRYMLIESIKEVRAALGLKD